MTFYIFSIIALLCWSGSDFFSKTGTAQDDKLSHWRVIFCVGAVMGLHAVITLIGGMFIDPEKVPKFVSSLFYTDFKPIDFIHYFPVAFVYLAAMVVGYVGLRYIELSVSSPICNSSGSLALLICVIFGLCEFDIHSTEGILSVVGVVLVALGIIALGITEYREDDEIKALRNDNSNFKYTKSVIAILIPILYLIIDALGTVGDQIIAKKELFDLSDYASNTAFEFTSLCFAIFAFIYVKFIKKQKFFTMKKDLFIGSGCETIGQVFYMAVMFSGFDAGIAIISSYCVMSVVWSRIFLKEKLSIWHYLSIAVTIAGIIILGIYSAV